MQRSARGFSHGHNIGPPRKGGASRRDIGRFGVCCFWVIEKHKVPLQLKHPRQRCFAALPRTGQYHHEAAVESPAQLGENPASIDHRAMLA